MTNLNRYDLWPKEANDMIDSLEAESKLIEKNYDALRDAVVILEDDAEPEVGDVVYYMNSYSPVPKGDDFGAKYARKVIHENIVNKYATGKIIQRNGRPVVYKSTLGVNHE